ncbi:MAG: glycosyltransferase [Candidatus Korobacteraceae bacterium]
MSIPIQSGSANPSSPQHVSPHRDQEALARQIRELGDWSEAALRRFYAKRAYERARRLFTAERMVDSYMGLYGSLSRRPGGEKTRPVAGAALG